MTNPPNPYDPFGSDSSTPQGESPYASEHLTTPLPSTAPTAVPATAPLPTGTYTEPAAPPYGSAAPQTPYGAPASTPYGSPPSPGPYAGSPYATSPYATAQPNPTNQMALVALICSLGGLVTGISLIAGIICGHIALNELKRNPGQQGRGMAVAALWVGYGLLALGVLVVIGFFLWIGYLSTTTSSY